MTIRSHWKRLKQAAFKAPTDTRSKLQRDFDLVYENLMMASRVVGDPHAYIHFNDNTHYRVCSRFKGTASLELPKCAALVVPTDDDVTIPADCTVADAICMQCVHILHDAIDEDTNIDPRLIWYRIDTGAMERADPHGTNLGNLADIV